jgi:hypothetical protein
MEVEMYYPYLRGKQYELIALRELVEKEIIGDKILPIIEPVKASIHLINFMQTYVNKNIYFGVIQNPEHGTFLQEIEQADKREYKDKYYSFFSNNMCCLPVYIFNKNIIRIEPLSVKQKSIAICNDEDIVFSIDKIAGRYNIDRYIIPDERTFKREINGDRILLADNFKKQSKNADYADSVDEFFSDDHIYFADEGFKGFSDFSIIGNDYSESGFAPYAVTIHMVYFDSEYKLRVYHFVSESNDDYDDPAGKFEEALEKLMGSSKIDKNTFAYNEFKRFYDNKAYSGLGVVKKLSIMHHIELISKYLKEKKK